MLGQITSNNLSSFNIDFILKSNCNFCRHLLYFYQLRFLCSLLRSVLQFQSRHNSHTDRCYVMSFTAGKRLDVIITVMKTVQCYVSCPSRYAKRKLPPSKPWRRPCQGETVKVKCLYNRITGKNVGRPNQISHHLQKSTRRDWLLYLSRFLWCLPSTK